MVGRRVSAVSVRHPAAVKTARPPLDTLVGREIVGLDRRGKLLLLRFDGGLTLVVHLMQAGRIGLRPAGAVPAGRQTAFHIALDDHRVLLARELGTHRRLSVHLLDGEDLALHPPLTRLGPEPLGLGAEGWQAALATPSGRVHTALRDGRRVAGIGRCYASEIMWAARLAPFAMTGALPRDAFDRLAGAASAVLRQATRGARERIDLDMPSQTRRVTVVHGHAGEPCLRCGAALARVSFAEYELVYCAECQTGGRRYADRRLSRLIR